MIRALLHALRPTRLRASVAAVLVVLFGTACNSTDVTDPTAVGTTTPVSTTDASATTALPDPTLASLTFSGIAYGPTGLWDNYTSLNWGPAMFTGTQAPVDAGGVVTLINSARTKGQRLVLAMTGGPSTNYTTGGKFDMDKWKRKMNTFNTATVRNAIASAVADGIIVGNSMIDEPETARWGGNISKATVDAMATYAKAMFPTMPMGINIGPPATGAPGLPRAAEVDQP